MTPPALLPLDESELSPAVQRLVGTQAPAAMKQMAARGLAPLPPRDLVVALYQLALVGDETIRTAAAASAGKLPDPVLKVALPAALPPQVLHFLAQKLAGRREAVELLLRNRALPDASVEYLASACGPDELDIISQDEQRMLRFPAIIAALYMNPRARASMALRAVELAARNGVTVDIPGFEDVVASLNGVTLTAADDADFLAVVPESVAMLPPAQQETGEPDPVHMTQEEIEKAQAEEEAGLFVSGKTEVEKKKRFEDLAIPLQIRAATMGNAFDRAVAIRSSIRTVSMAAARSPGLRINEVVKFAANRALHEDVIRYISNKKEWVQLASIKLALLNNNKTPLGTAMRFLAYVTARELKFLAKSKNIPGPLQKAAKDLVQKREQKK